MLKTTEHTTEYTIRFDDNTEMWYIWVDGERYNRAFWYEADAERYIPELD